ncbi:hypothetical protein FALBO_17236 [Fusarium albosuccineum]|uniref:Uncharacterized protein n=1 Tax=Fusarium albosuccineum TaxID=1237068 RepID=A0A8H4NQX1_9HYPO|nr:hypothetical protein FALBO_17236 [Fusarium albosuccineum]
MARLQIWIAFGQRRGNDPLHWMIVTSPEDHSTATWYHVVGGPTQGGGYKLMIQSPKRFDSHGISEHHYVGELDEKDQKKLKASAQKIPAQYCQGWTVQVLSDLERKGLVPAGTAEHWHNQVEPNPYEAGGSSASGSGSSTQGGSSRGSSSQGGSSSGSGSQGPEWVWDQAYGQYKYWDAAANRWVWASEVGQ